MALLGAIDGNAQTAAVPVAQPYEYEETRALVALVDDATELVRAKGEAAFADLRVAGSRWRQADTDVFVLDPGGKMLLHPDPTMEGKNEVELRDVTGKPIIRGLISARPRRSPTSLKAGTTTNGRSRARGASAR